MTSIRQFDFVTGVETSTEPTAGTPTVDDDFMTLGYANENYVQGGEAVATITALKAVAAADRKDNDVRFVDDIKVFYQFDSSSSDTGDDDLVLTPDAGTGRWLKITNAARSFFRYDNQAESRYHESGGANYTGFKAPSSLSGNVIYELPTADGSNGQALLTDSNKVLSWGNPTAADPLVSAKSASYTITDGDGIGTVKATGGSGTFDFVDGDVNTGTDTITENSHGMADGTPVYLSTNGVLPTGLSAGKTYFVRDTATNTFKLAETVGGSAVDITAAAGGGTHSLYYGITITLPTAADNTNRVIVITKADDTTGRVIVDGEGSETIDSNSFVLLSEQGDSRTVQSDGTNWLVTSKSLKVNSHYIVSEPSGHGSTDTHIREFTNTEDSSGRDILYHTGSVTGSRFWIGADGMYTLTYQDTGPGANTRLGITKNSPNLTTQPGNDVLEGYTLAIFDTTASGYHAVLSVTVPLVAGDVIRAQTDSGPTNTTWRGRFTITQVSKD